MTCMSILAATGSAVRLFNLREAVVALLSKVECLGEGDKRLNPGQVQVALTPACCFAAELHRPFGWELSAIICACMRSSYVRTQGNRGKSRDRRLHNELISISACCQVAWLC